MSCMHILAVAVLSTAVSGPFAVVGISSFPQAKAADVRMSTDVSGDSYCGCKIDRQGKKDVIGLESCDYKVCKNENRVNRVEWEHVVPAWQSGHQCQYWQEGGWQNCVKDPEYRKMESDMYNLQPAVGEVNGDRDNFVYSQWNGDEGQYGQCTMKVDFKDKVVGLSARACGAITRTYFYMRDRYQLNPSRQQTQLFTAWDKQYLVIAWECERDGRIARVQGNHNPYVQQARQAQKS